jgi:4-amino-4-deoxy-L-arabinose transferase-like glycosyltransferase
MSKENSNKYLLIALICLGGILRLTVFWVSPANNAYDDHLEVVSIYAEDFNRPAPFQCWECYQPPLYYYTGATVYKITKLLGGSQAVCWKMVQAINPLLSIFLLLITYKILMLFKLQKLSVAITLSFIIVLPRDIFTSAMLGNDYMLVFFAVLAFYLFLETVTALNKGKRFLRWLCALVLAVILGSLTKQHGLLLLLFPGIIFLLLFRKAQRKKLYWAIPILILGVLLSLSEEAWKYNQTGKFLVSNQHYFDYAKNQFPGSLEKVEFFTFRIFKLYQNPFISDYTSASFFTELFARTFYDYEWRFISPKIPWATTLGYIAYSLGLIWGLFFIVILLSCKKQYQKINLQVDWHTIAYKIVPLFLAFLYILVPFIQTLRSPYFSSMKSMFMLPGIILLLITLGSLIKQNSLAQQLGRFMIALNIFYGIILVISISVYLGVSVNQLHGPLWPFP